MKYKETMNHVENETSSNEKFYQKELFEYKLKHWFKSMDPLELADCMDVDVVDMNYDSVIRYAMDKYAERLFEYMEEHKEMVWKITAKNEEEEDLCNIKVGVFDYAGIWLDSEIEEVFNGDIVVSEEKELWLLENGDLVVIQCVAYEGEDRTVEYRNLDHYLEDFGTAGIDIERFLSCLAEIV